VQAHAKRQATIATDPETQEHLLKAVAPVFAVAVGRMGFLGTLSSGFVGAVETNRRGILMNPGCFNLGEFYEKFYRDSGTLRS
jgi:hypothetical protein